MRTQVETVIAGGGQAGLAVSYYLTRQGRDHLVLEQSDRAAEAWRNHRWDSFTLNTPNWQTRLPGAEYSGNDPDGFMSRSDVVAYLVGLTVERMYPQASLPVFLFMYFLMLWVSWVIAVRVTAPKAEPQPL